MSDRSLRSVIMAMEHSSLSSLCTAETGAGPRELMIHAGAERPPVLNNSVRSPKFDTQMMRPRTRSDSSDTSDFLSSLMTDTADDQTGLISQRRNSISDARTASGDQRASPKGAEAPGSQGSSGRAKQPTGLVVALFHDGFVCRHINKENECVDGFAQPYDAESSYFLACIDNGRVPAGLPDMIACAHYNGSVLAEIRDYREMKTALCPVSSAFLPAASALPQASDLEIDNACRVWQTLLQPSKSLSSPVHTQVSPLLEPPTLQSVLDHFPGSAPGELESIALEANRQFLQEDNILLNSPSSTESSPRNGAQTVEFFSAVPQAQNGHDEVESLTLTTTPTTRSRLQNALETSPPASLLSPLERKSARSSLVDKITTEEDTTTRCQRQISATSQQINARNQIDDELAADDEDNMNMGSTGIQESSQSSEESQDEEMEEYESSGSESGSGYSNLLDAETFSVTPLPATQLFLSKLKGKKPRTESELLYGKPAWVTIAQIGTFFRAATRLEREHSRFLHDNARRLMQAEKPPPEAAEHVAGSMRFLARQLGDLTRPSDVIAVSNARKWKTARDEGRQYQRPDWVDVDSSSPGPASDRADASTALVSPDSEPVLGIDIDTKVEEHVCESPPVDLINVPDDQQLAMEAPHFNTFDDDGHLQPQLA